MLFAIFVYGRWAYGGKDVERNDVWSNRVS